MFCVKVHFKRSVLAVLIFAIIGIARAPVMGIASAQSAAPPDVVLDTTSQRTSDYRFLLFWRNNDVPTAEIRHAMDQFLARQGRAHGFEEVSLNDASQQPLIAQYGVSRAPMPLLLAVAPNGAVTDAMFHPVTEERIAAAVVSPGAAECLKATQDGKLVILCIQKSSPGTPASFFDGVRALVSDDKFVGATYVVTIDAEDPVEGSFLQQLDIQEDAPLPITILLAPQGGILGKVSGMASKEELVQRIANAQSECCPGGQCADGKCCPGGTCDTGQKPAAR